jgi:hypothetical protein
MPVRATGKEKSPGIALAEGLLSVINELVQLMILEMELVGARKLQEHKELLKRKQRLAIDYRASIKSIAAQPDILKTLPDNIRALLKEAAQKLADITDRNAKFLRTAVLATLRLIQNIVSIVKQEVLPQPGYRNPTTAHLQLGNYSPTCKPVAVNRTA